jgi:predicted nucleotide-binding protein (sugar kinase/HSP70/actin superfamily)
MQAPEEDRKPGKFRGLDLYREQIEVRSEVCDLCNNHCNLRLAEVRGETVAYGFLCGRDYDVQKFVSSNRSGFDLMKERRLHFSFERQAGPGPVVGIPAALYLLGELPLWRKFFDLLGVRTVTSQSYTEAVTRGKRLAAAEFCAPMAAFHGHVAYLSDKADYIFTPIYLEAEHKSGTRRQYCYYSQYAPSLISTMEQIELTDRCLMPLIHSGKGGYLLPSYRLYHALRPALGKGLSLVSVTAAYREARRFYEEKKRQLPDVMENARQDDQVSVVLIGRPYTALSPTMNKLIPEILGGLGVKVFYQDMLPVDDKELTGEIRDLLGQIHWKYAADLLTAAWKVAKTPGLYPVVITSFMCAPDSCTLESFRRIMDRHEKPHLILQIDEHDSRTGYETRIEAAVRSFENHMRGARPSGDSKSLPLSPVISRKPGDKVVLVPPWDTYAVRLFCANLVHEGIDARMLDETQLSIQKSLRTNTGQCIPLNTIVQDFIDYVERHDLDPADCVLWQPRSSISCNIGFFPQYAKGLLESHGGGFEKAEVYAGETSGTDISVRAVINSYFAYFFAGNLRRAACKLRPYEVRPGSVDAAIAECLDLLSEVMRTGGDKLAAAREVVDRLTTVEVGGSQPSSKFEGKPQARPQVAIFGDLYARDNDVMNQGLIDTIEENGGEVLTTPYSEYGRIVVKPYLKKWLREGNYWDVFATAVAWASVNLMETKYVEQFERVLGPAPEPVKSTPIEEVLALFGVDPHHTGESFDNLLKVFHLVERYPNLALFVQTNPAFCCPSLVTEAMGRQIERATGVPVVTVTYDGTASNKNEVVIPYLQLARESGPKPTGKHSSPSSSTDTRPASRC